ncbi:MAG: hypothetical protein ACE5OR_03940 [bacterium]
MTDLIERRVIRVARTGATLSTYGKRWGGKGKNGKDAGRRRRQPQKKEENSRPFQRRQRPRERITPLAERLDEASLKALKRFRKSLKK